MGTRLGVPLSGTLGRSHGLLITVTDERLAPLCQLHGKVVQFLEVVARIGDLPRFETEPSDHLQDRVKVDALFRSWIGIVEPVRDSEQTLTISSKNSPKITTSVVVLRVTKVDRDGFGMADMQVSVGFGRESREDTAFCPSQVLLLQLRLDLGVLSWLVQL